MGIATIYSRAQSGMEDSPLISVEVRLSSGLPCFSIVSLMNTKFILLKTLLLFTY